MIWMVDSACECDTAGIDAGLYCHEAPPKCVRDVETAKKQQNAKERNYHKHEYTIPLPCRVQCSLVYFGFRHAATKGGID